jgi:hypothetical protein
LGGAVRVLVFAWLLLQQPLLPSCHPNANGSSFLEKNTLVFLRKQLSSILDTFISLFG